MTALAHSMAPKLRVFVTVGAQMPFDRLVTAIDGFAQADRSHAFFAQIGETSLAPRHIEWTRFLAPGEFERAFDAADAIVAHAGTGTLLAALERGKPIVVMPRRASLRETRNDHQIATARRFAELAGVAIAWDEGELAQRLRMLDGARPTLALASEAQGTLVRTISSFIDGE